MSSRTLTDKLQSWSGPDESGTEKDGNSEASACLQLICCAFMEHIIRQSNAQSQAGSCWNHSA